MKSVHDNVVISYEVNLRDRYIEINTETDKDIEVKIKFYDVMAHLFEDHLYGSILFDIERYEIDSFLKGNKEILEKRKPYCWPTYYESLDELRELLIKDEYKYYVIGSSYGFNGWVLAKKIEIKKMNPSDL
ncbi:hypothetical protein M6D81_22955 [Paenibacillus sp. J5C_2022]|uniref:hypothetical protein n=1 Tax=Paenibacillus sp. J5C2022 TaxID=2977129 RepID=UPI0021D2D57B|nr:hypothetical protein [Paenibacillus sp. J5C2022]MCU6711560.1 hypothetical protein [Paenibacillus sp. J5C2022]